MKKFVVVASCPERLGIVHAVSAFFLQAGVSVVDAAQYTDQDQQRFYMRWECQSDKTVFESIAQLSGQFTPIATQFGMDFKVFDANAKTRTIIAVSKFGHCLNDLLNRWKYDQFPADIVAVVSNHETFREQVEWYGVPFHYLPISKDTKAEQEQQLLQVMADTDAELLVLARYMQILSDNLCTQLTGRAINIHHSFLPSFVGAKPYHRAFARGVKITGATAHYVTKDLDEGPIIEQDVQRIEHHHDVESLVRRGQNIESSVLARAVYWHCKHRVVISGNKTIVFK